jgi:signal transduction histidine kinase
MSSLRSRIAALLIAAIVAVVMLATLAAQQTLQPPSQASTIQPTARQLSAAVIMAEQQPGLLPANGFSVQAEPFAGNEDVMFSRLLEESFLKDNAPRTAIIVRDPTRAAPVASIALQTGGWLVTEIPDLGPPPGGWKTFGMWIALIILGSVVVSIFATMKITRPLELLENAARSIRPDGSLPHIPVTGSGEIRATAIALNGLSSRLKASVESRMRLVAAAGHDLRTPMTRMRLRAEFVEDPAEQAKWLADLEELDAIADSAILLVREEVSDDPVTDIDLGKLLQNIVSELQELGHQGKLTYVPPPEPTFVEAAPFALKRALRNLVLNAITHGLRAQIELSKNNGSTVVSIHDEGPGIPGDLIERVFEPFFRVDPARRKSVPGAGLGLAIAKEIIGRSGGTVSVANRNPKGLTQTVTFPAKA